MKSTLARLFDYGLWAALVFVLISFVSRKMSGPSEGAIAQAFDLPLVDSSGARFRLEEHRGKAVLVEVFASWCGVCRRTAPTLAQAYQKHSPRGVEFVAISVDESAELARHAKTEWGIPYPVALDDGGMSKKYGIEVLPTFILVGPDGRVRHVATGAISESRLDKWLQNL